MTEDLLQFVWENLLFDQRNLQTTNLETIEILQSGRIQHGQGPDINSALIRIAGQSWAGTVEVHFRSSEWYGHGHHTDEAYENVVLHVVWENDVPTRTISGRNVPTFELQNRISSDSLKQYDLLMKDRGWVPCANQLTYVDPNLIAIWLEKLLVQRLERKTDLVLKELEQAGNDESEVFFRSLSKAFGSKENDEPFAMLARSIPLRLLRKYRDDGIRLEALMFGQAGMLQVNFVDAYPSKLQHEYEILKSAHGLKPIPMAAWKFGRLRPSNFPTVRIALLASLIIACDGDLNRLLSVNTVKQMHELLDVSASREWNDRYTLDERSVPRVKKLGKAFANGIIVNAVVPFIFAQGQYHRDSDRSQLVMDLMGQMQSADDRVVRGWRELGVASETMGRSQALLELKNEYCSAKNCLNCAIGMELMKRTYR